MYLLKPLLAIFNNLSLVFIGILGIGFIIGFHELGHFLFGKLFKIKTPSFAVGFGPKIYKRKIGETNFSIGAIPLGGYVESDKESFESKPYWQKMFVLSGGIAFNLIFAYFVFCLLFMLGLPKTKFLYPINATQTISTIAKTDEIEKLGIKPGDKIIAINGQSLEKTSQLFKKLELLAADKSQLTQPVTLTIERTGQTQELKLEAKPFINALIKMQIAFKYAQPKGLGFFQSLKNGVKLTNSFIKRTLLIFKYMFAKRDTSALGGPILIISETVKGASKGAKIFLLLLAIISISLAIINLIPLPILDGGQALLCTVEAIVRRKLSDRTKEFIFMISWAFMLILIVLISTRDVWRIIKAFLAKK